MRYQSRYFEVNLPSLTSDLRNLPPATKFLTLAYVTFTLSLFCVSSFGSSLPESSNAAESKQAFSPILQLVPCQTLYHPWSIVLSNLIDVKFWKTCVDLFNLVIGGSFIERNWNSSKELVRYVLVIGSLTNIVVVITSLVSSAIFPQVRLDVPLDGNYTMLVGFCIIYKQLIPETTIFHIKNLPIISKNFRFKLLPIFVLVITTATQLVWFHHFSQLVSIWVTFFCCWIYLRFYQVLPPAMIGDSTKCVVGDASDTFQLIYFFPDLLKPALRPLFQFCYYLFCVKFRIREPFNDNDVETGNSLAEHRGAKTVINQVEERRKRLALEALHERLHTEP